MSKTVNTLFYYQNSSLFDTMNIMLISNDSIKNLDFFHDNLNKLITDLILIEFLNVLELNKYIFYVK